MTGVDGGRAERLDTLAALLAERDTTTVDALASDLGVSVRTVQRDLATLRNRGMPIEGERGRGGGIRLERGWSLGRVHLNESEAIGLLLSLAIAEKIGSPLLLSDLRSITRKVGNAFAPAQAARIRQLRARVLVGRPASTAVLGSYEQPPPGVTAPLLDAFWRRRLATITYVDGSGALTERTIEAQVLYYSVPVWYVVAWDSSREDVRSFRLDRITRITVLDEEFRLRPADAFLSAGEPEARPV